MAPYRDKEYEKALVGWVSVLGIWHQLIIAYISITSKVDKNHIFCKFVIAMFHLLPNPSPNPARDVTALWESQVVEQGTNATVNLESDYSKVCQLPFLTCLAFANFCHVLHLLSYLVPPTANNDMPLHLPMLLQGFSGTKQDTIMEKA